MTYSEVIFDRYLRQLGYKPRIDYYSNFKINGNPPIDFYINKSNPKILVQIKEFNPYAKKSKRRRQLKEEKMYDGYDAEDLRNKIDEIGNQFEPYKDSTDYICIGVIQDHPMFIAFRKDNIAEAMYGDQGVRVTQRYPKIEYHLVFNRNGAMSKRKNTRISAICSLTSAADNTHILEDGNVIKCICVLNHFSKKRVQHSFFSGSRDEIWGINKDSGSLEKLSPPPTRAVQF